MTSLALIAVRLAEGILAISARERWSGGVQHIQSGSDFASGVWFKIAAAALFAGTVIAFLIVNLYNRFSQGKSANREFIEGVSRRQLTEIEINTLIAIADRAGLEKMTDIFLMSDAFERGAGILVKESFIAGKPTNETVRVEKHLTALRAKMNFRKAAGGAYSTGAVGKRYKASFIALFPFVRTTDLTKLRHASSPVSGNRERSQKDDSPPGLKSLLPEFKPAIATGLVGRVLFIETMAGAKVGDRVLIMISPGSTEENAEVSGVIQVSGTVEQSSQPAEMLKDPNARRLGAALDGLSNSQIAQLAGIVKGVKMQETKKQNAGDSGEAAKVLQPASKENGAK
jgi:hypothetical protein